MRLLRRYRPPADKEAGFRRAARLEWITISAMLVVIAVIYLAMGSSQAMKAAWVEDMLSLVPPIAYLIAFRFRNRTPSTRFPYGFLRADTIAFLVSAVSLAMFGLFIFYDSVAKLVTAEHPTVGLTVVFGYQVWEGWLMIAALAFSAVPPVILGRMKLPLAQDLHEKALYTDAQMNKADWLTAVAGIVGVLGIGMGWWWADAVAAGVISFDILKDGVTNLKQGVEDLMDEYPTVVGKDEPDDLPERLRRELEAMPWVERADVRLREMGHVFVGEAFVVVRDTGNLQERLRDAGLYLEGLDWRLHDLSVVPVPDL